MQCNKGLIRLYLDYGGPSSYHVTHLYIFYILPEYVRETERERERGGEREGDTEGINFENFTDYWADNYERIYA